MKKLVAFDLDGTLAESKQALGQPMAEALSGLLAVVPVAVISGGDWPQFDKQIVSRLPAHADLTRLFIMPTTGTKLYRFDGVWRRIYADVFAPEEKAGIMAAFGTALAKTGLDKDKSWGERIEDRESQITFSGLGQSAPLDAKSGWDPNQEKRRKLQAMLRKSLPDLSITIGGSTSIDITRRGIDKAYAMRRLADVSDIPTTQMLFFGDAIFPGGNDDPVRAAGIDSVKVRDPQETATAIAAIIACLKPA
jgi:HAD superfamily hydrolase (TIGR01484 family)